MKVKKTIALTLSTLSIFSLVACGASENKDDRGVVYGNTGKVYETNVNEDKSLSDSLALRKKYASYWTPMTDYKTMPIGAYNGLPPSGKYGFSYDYEKLLSDYNELGVNFLFGLYNSATGNLEFEKTTLELCEEYNISYLSLWGWDAHFSTETSIRNKKSVLDELLKYPSCMGINIVDEPGYLAFDNMTTARDGFKNVIGANADEYLYHVNLLPSWTGCEPLYTYRGNETVAYEVYKDYTYAQYLSDYMRIYNPQVLSYDFYPIIGIDKRLKDGYFENLSVIREKAIEANIPFWTFVQTCTWSGDERLPSQGELLWNVNTCLAYGAKGIEYFCGVEPYNSSADEHFNASLFYKDGSHSVVYDSALVANKQIQAIDDVLMCAKNKGVIFVGDMPALNDGTRNTMTPSTDDVLKSYNELASVSAFHTLIGCFNYEGKTVLYVVNNSVEEADSVNLQFNKNLSGTYTYDAVEKNFTGNSLHLDLGAGDGVLVVID